MLVAPHLVSKCGFGHGWKPSPEQLGGGCVECMYGHITESKISLP